MMSAIDRVMRAYSRKHDLESGQAALVRAELAKFIDDLLSKNRREPMMLPETKYVAKPKICNKAAERPG